MTAQAAMKQDAEELGAITVDMFCERFRISRPVVYREINEKRLRTFMVGRRRLISLDAVRDWIATQERTTAGKTQN